MNLMCDMHFVDYSMNYLVLVHLGEFDEGVVKDLVAMGLGEPAVL